VSHIFTTHDSVSLSSLGICLLRQEFRGLLPSLSLSLSLRISVTQGRPTLDPKFEGSGRKTRVHAHAHAHAYAHTWQRDLCALLSSAHLSQTQSYSLSHLIFLLGQYTDRTAKRTKGVRFPVMTGNFSLRRLVQTGSGVHPASYPMGNRGSFPGVK